MMAKVMLALSVIDDIFAIELCDLGLTLELFKGKCISVIKKRSSYIYMVVIIIFGLTATINEIFSNETCINLIFPVE